jgi:phage shock protein A
MRQLELGEKPVGIFSRVGRVIRSEINHQNQAVDTSNLSNLGTEPILAAGGAVAGASIGKVGLLAGGAGYSIGTIPLMGAGALTGFALYEALRSGTHNDASSLEAAALGGIAGAAASSAIGGVGLAIGGTAVGVGMAPMVAAGAIAGLGLAGLSRCLQHGIDPEKLLDLVIEQMQAELAEPRQALANLIATQKQTERQYSQANTDANTFLRRAHLALQKGDEGAARELLVQKKSHGGIATRLQIQLDQLGQMVDTLNKSLLPLEAKLAEAQAKREMLCARIKAAKANAQGQLGVNNMSTGSAMTAFERMEDKLLQIMETRSQAAADLAGLDLESQFALLETASNVDDELAEIKTVLLGGSDNRQAGSRVTPTTKPVSPQGSVVDAELESLKIQLDKL